MYVFALTPGFIQARNLLQVLELSNVNSSSSQILSTILARMTATSSTSWNGHLQGIDASCLRIALWEMIARRWISVFERFSEPEHLETLAQFLVASISTIEKLDPNQISVQTVTARLLRRADFYEMRKLQGKLDRYFCTSG